MADSIPVYVVVADGYPLHFAIAKGQAHGTAFIGIYNRSLENVYLLACHRQKYLILSCCGDCISLMLSVALGKTTADQL